MRLKVVNICSKLATRKGSFTYVVKAASLTCTELQSPGKLPGQQTHRSQSQTQTHMGPKLAVEILQSVCLADRRKQTQQ